MTNSDTAGIRNGTRGHEGPPPPSPGPSPSGAGSQPDADQLITATRLLSRDDRPHSLDDLLFELGRHGLALGYIGGEPSMVSVAGAPHRSLASMGLGDRWIECLGEWDRNVRHEPDEDGLDYGGQDPGTDAIDRLWSRQDPLGRRLTQSERASVRRFLGLLPFGVVDEAMRIAADNVPDERGPAARFRYFAGICWRKLKGGRAQKSSAPDRRLG